MRALRSLASCHSAPAFSRPCRLLSALLRRPCHIHSGRKRATPPPPCVLTPSDGARGRCNPWLRLEDSPPRRQTAHLSALPTCVEQSPRSPTLLPSLLRMTPDLLHSPAMSTRSTYSLPGVHLLLKADTAAPPRSPARPDAQKHALLSAY